LGRNGREVIGDFEPIVDTDKSGGGEVVRGTIEKAVAFEAEKVFGLIVDEEVGAEDGFVAAEDVVRGRDEGKVALEPAVFGAQGVGDGHGLRGDENFETRRKFFEDWLRVRHEGQILEEVFGVEESAELGLAIERGNFPEAFAREVFERDGVVEGLVVAAQVLGEGVGHDFVHVDADTLHGCLQRIVVSD